MIKLFNQTFVRWKRAFLATISVTLFLALTGCATVVGDSQANFYVAYAGRGPGYSPQGYGWKSGSTVSIDIWNEPDGPGSASTSWKHLFNVVVDPYGMFGFTGTPPFYPVSRNFCGQPEQGQTMVFKATSLTTGRILMSRPPVDQYFTFKPCP